MSRPRDREVRRPLRLSPDLLGAVVVVGALGLLLPLEWSLADALGLPG